MKIPEKHLIIKVLLSLFVLYVVYSSFIFVNVLFSTKKYTQYENIELLRIKIYGSSSSDEGNTISGTFSVLDSNGNEIAVIERSWSGSYLNVDFAQSKILGKYYVFPTKIYGKNRIFDIKTKSKKGTDLAKYYNENGQSILLGYGSSYKQRRSLYKISRFVLNKYSIFNFLVKRKTLRIDLSNCKTGKYYSITTTKNGNVVVDEL